MRLLLLLLFVHLTTACMANSPDTRDMQALADKSRSDALQYIRSLPDDCAYSDGYICVENSKATESAQFGLLMDKNGTLPATVLSAWPAAYKAFLGQDLLSDEQKNLKHYRIGFAQEGTQTTVLFRPLLLPQLVDGQVVGKMRATFGKEVRVTINQADLSVAKVIFGR